MSSWLHETLTVSSSYLASWFAKRMLLQHLLHKECVYSIFYAVTVCGHQGGPNFRGSAQMCGLNGGKPHHCLPARRGKPKSAKVALFHLHILVTTPGDIWCLTASLLPNSHFPRDCETYVKWLFLWFSSQLHPEQWRSGNQFIKFAKWLSSNCLF